jgi:hypothetical protein
MRFCFAREKSCEISKEDSEMKTRKLANWVLVLMVLLLPLRAFAQGIIVVPGPNEDGDYIYDYGNVVVGSTAIMVFEIISHPDHFSDLTVEEICITRIAGDQYCSPGSESDEFTIVSYPGDLPYGPAYLSPGESGEVVVEYSPTDLNLHTAMLYITTDATNDPPGMLVGYELLGRGVSSEPPPSYLMSALIAAYDSAIDDGRLFGFGPGNSASGRLKAFGNMLDAADDLIQEGNYEQACIQLTDAYNRADSDFPPPDFIYGPALGEIQTGINEVLTALGCQ